MQIQSLQVQQFRRFDQPVQLTGLKAGLNIIAGPNEAGKSTLVQALRTVFFERYTTGSGPLGAILPWGDASAAPEITVRFQLNNKDYSLQKRFFKNRRCFLDSPGQRLEGEQAEQHLAQLLGYDYAPRGASLRKHWGVPGLLWVEQGQGQEFKEAVVSAGTSLQQALGQHVTELASTEGEKILERVRQELALLVTGVQGQPRGEWAAGIKQAEQQEQERQQIEAQLQEYRQWVDQLYELQRQVSQYEREQPWIALQQKEQQAKEQLQQASVLKNEIQALQQQRELLRLNLGRVQDWLDTQAQGLQQQQKQQAEYEKLNAALPALLKQQASLSQRYEQACKERDQYEAYREQARQLQLWQAQQQQHQRAREDAAHLSELVRQAQDQEDLYTQTSARFQAEPIEAETVKQALQLQTQIQRLQMQLEAQAPELQFELQPQAYVVLDQERLAGTGRRLLSRVAHIDLGDAGTLKIVPAATADLDSLRSALSEHQRQLHTLLQQYQADDIAQLQERLNQKQQYARDMQHIQAVLQSYAPQGLSALKAKLQSLQQQTQQELAKPDVEHQEQVDLNDVASLLETYERHKKWAQQLEKERLPIQSQVQQTQATLQVLQQELARKKEQETQSDYQAELARKKQQAGDLGLQEHSLIQQIQTLEQRYQTIGADLLEQDIGRYQRSAQQQKQLYEQAREQKLVLQTRLESHGAQGLDERKAELDGQLKQWERRHAQFERRRQALRLLLDTLESKRQELTASLQQPLQAKMQHYLRFLPGASMVELDSDLNPVGLQRQHQQTGLADKVEELSFGTREQLGLIARLAYADLLQEAGHPTLLMLDDALVHSDGVRLEHMKRMLDHAAQRHQILLFTCQEDKWRDMGVVIQALPQALQ